MTQAANRTSTSRDFLMKCVWGIQTLFDGQSYNRHVFHAHVDARTIIIFTHYYYDADAFSVFVLIHLYHFLCLPLFSMYSPIVLPDSATTRCRCPALPHILIPEMNFIAF